MAAYGVMRRGLCAPKRVVDGGPRHVISRSTEIGNLVADLRRSLKIRQEDLAARAGVGRQWITALERGKPTLEIAPVLRTLATLGLEIELKPYDPIPTWIVRATLDAEARAHATRHRRNARRRGRREQARLKTIAANAPTVWPDLE